MSKDRVKFRTSDERKKQRVKARVKNDSFVQAGKLGHSKVLTGLAQDINELIF